MMAKEIGLYRKLVRRLSKLLNKYDYVNKDLVNFLGNLYVVNDELQKLTKQFDAYEKLHEEIRQKIQELNSISSLLCYDENYSEILALLNEAMDLEEKRKKVISKIKSRVDEIKNRNNMLFYKFVFGFTEYVYAVLRVMWFDFAKNSLPGKIDYFESPEYREFMRDINKMSEFYTHLRNKFLSK